MQGLQALYKFTYTKPKSWAKGLTKEQQNQLPKELPKDMPFISQIDNEEKIFFYQLEGANYISLDVLLKSYASQLIRVSIGQWLLLIQKIYQALLQSYYNNESLGKITLENIWIYTDTGFCGTITPQTTLEIIFLNYHDSRISIQNNLIEFSAIQDQIWKICRSTEFKLRVRDGKNSLDIQQIMNVIDQILFYEVQQTLYKEPQNLAAKINEFVDEQQETLYEYYQENLQYIQNNYVLLIGTLNKISDPTESSTEFQQHYKLLEWQRALFNSFQGFEWNQQSYEYTLEILEFVKTQILENDQLEPYKIKYMEREIFYFMEQFQFFNFNSPKVRLSSVISIKRQIKASLAKQIIDPIKAKYDVTVEAYKNAIFRMNNQNQVIQQIIELTQLQKYYSLNSGKFYGLNYKFYFTINFQLDWEKVLIAFITNDTIILQKEQLDRQLNQMFQQLEEKYIK